MKKKLVLIAGLLLSLAAKNNLMAQDSKGADFQNVKGINLLNAGIGLGSYGLSGTGGLPLTASFEHGFSKNISAGASLGFIQKKYFDSWKYTYLLFGARGSYHFNEALKITNPKVDVYAGAGLLYRHYSIKYTDKGFDGEPMFNVNTSGGDITIDLHAGARYLFSDRIGGFAELGYGISPLQLGLAVKF